MKRIASSFIAVALAIMAFAFTNAHAKLRTNSYWFQTRSDGSVINSTTIPPFQSTDPNGCVAGGDNCSKAYTSYQQLGPNEFAPAGTLVVSHKH